MKNLLSKIVLVLAAALMLPVSAAMAQNENPSNLTSSAYTRYGFGKLGSVSNASTRAMGDIGVVAYSNSFTNLYNPASLTAIDTLTMLVEAGFNGEWQFTSENGKHQKDFNSGFNYLSFHFPLWNRFAGALSLTPYSMVGYYYGTTTKNPIDNSISTTDTLSYTNNYQGTGGLQKIMASIGWRPIKGKNDMLNVGLNIALITGSVSHAGSVSITSGQAHNTYITRGYSAKGLDLGLGVQYLRRLSIDRTLLFGATFSPKTPIKVSADNIKIAYQDTISVHERFNVSAPMKFGIGAAYHIDRKLQVGAEYSLENWSKVAGLDANMKKTDDIYKNINKFAVGVEYQPSTFNQSYFKTCRYRAGLNFKNSYIETFGSQSNEYTASVGIGMPVGLMSRRRSLLNLSVEYTHLQPSDSKLMSEDYINITLGVTFNEMMFFRNRLR